MPTLTDVRQELTKALESTTVPKPFYAVAGVGDLAVEKLRDLHLEQRIAGLGDGARALPATVVDAALAASGRATGLYDDLTDRGKKLVDGLGAQRAVTITDAAPAKQPAAEKKATTKATTKTNGTTAAKSRSKSTATKKTAAKKPAAKKS